jgi:hypothetical protein
MSQSRRMSLVEAVTNTVGGFIVALGCQVLIFPWWGVHIALASSAGIAVCMMVQSLVRQYLFRRFFDWLDRWMDRRHQQRMSDLIEGEIERCMLHRM